MQKAIIFLLIIFFLCAGAFVKAKDYYETGNSLKEPAIVIIEKGDGMKLISNKLGAAKVIKYPELLLVIARVNKTTLKHGEYEFPPGISPKEVLQKLSNGEVKTRKFTIPEGKTVYEVGEILKSSYGLKGEMPQIAEGTILPSTYQYHYGDNYADVIKQMQGEMIKTLSALWTRRAKDLPISTPEQAVILASIVERETGKDDERGLVASVFVNRLRKGMKLESDPTAVYGITHGAPLGHIPTKDDVGTKTEYNTYIIDGLPPAPIANPGIKSIEAVLNPPQTDYLFFVATGEGGHNFSATLKEHNNNIKKYRQALAAIKN